MTMVVQYAVVKGTVQYILPVDEEEPWVRRVKETKRSKILRIENHACWSCVITVCCSTSTSRGLGGSTFLNPTVLEVGMESSTQLDDVELSLMHPKRLLFGPP